MQNLFEELKTLLKSNPQFVSEGKLLKNKVIESALKLDQQLIDLLFSNERIRRKFFTTIGGGSKTRSL